MRPLARNAYRAILLLHPRDFREEFGEEMLWVFTEELGRRPSRALTLFRLLLDGLGSALVQQMLRPRERKQQAVVAGAYLDLDSPVPLVRFAQAGFLTVSCVSLLFSISLFVSMVAPKITPLNASRWLYTPIKFVSSAK
jgi:hypothetical protein